MFYKYEWAINLLILFYKFFPRKIRLHFFRNARYSKGILGLAKRYALLRTIAISCGKNVLINEGVFFISPQNLSVGDNVSIQPMCYIDSNGGIEIGSDVSIAHSVSLLSTNHNYSDKNIPIRDQGVTCGKIVIGDNVWIGAKATILYRTEIQNGSIVGAGAVVSHKVNQNEIVVGVPAKVLKER